MTPPTVHLNGTSKEALLSGYEEAYNALQAAYHKLRETSPNGRDYYPQGEGAIHQAVKEHDARLRKVNDVLKELDELIGAVEAQ